MPCLYLRTITDKGHGFHLCFDLCARGNVGGRFTWQWGLGRVQLFNLTLSPGVSSANELAMGLLFHQATLTPFFFLFQHYLWWNYKQKSV